MIRQTKMMIVARAMGLFTGLLLTASLSIAQQRPVEQVKPALSEDQLGHLRHIVELARQLPGDWRYMEPREMLSYDAYQFQIAFISYGLAMVQVNYTPAYRELYENAQLALIEKMLRRDVWAPTWLPIIEMEPFKNYLPAGKEWRDPVREKNIMYSGHLLQMVSLYSVLYQDTRFDKPDSMVFELSGLNGFRNGYSHDTLAELVFRQFEESGHVGIECEPNNVYAECNQHAALGLIHYDWNHDSALGDVGELFWQKAEELEFIATGTSRTMYHYRVAERELIDKPYAWSDGWNGLMMHAWKPEVVGRHYPAQRDSELAGLLDQNPERWSQRWSSPYVSYDFGFLAAYAAELGDEETVTAMLAYASEHFHPQSSDGRTFFPRRDVIDAGFLEGDSINPRVPEDKYGQHELGTLASNALLPFAVLNPGRGLERLYDKRFVMSALSENAPEVVNIQYPEVMVISAHYEEEASSLTLQIKPGTAYRGLVDVGIANLNDRQNYSVLLDGEVAYKLSQGAVTKVTGGPGSADWNTGSATLTVSLPIDSGRHIELVSDYAANRLDVAASVAETR